MFVRRSSERYFSSRIVKKSLIVVAALVGALALSACGDLFQSSQMITNLDLERGEEGTVLLPVADLYNESSTARAQPESLVCGGYDLESRRCVAGPRPQEQLTCSQSPHWTGECLDVLRECHDSG